MLDLKMLEIGRTCEPGYNTHTLVNYRGAGFMWSARRKAAREKFGPGKNR